jgi:alpha-L-fucosidase
VDQHQPDLLYSDGGLPFYGEERQGNASITKWLGANCPEPGLNLVAHLYNLSARRHGGKNQAVYTQKDQRPEVAAIGVLDIERGKRNAATQNVWQTDTCVGGWFYDVRQVYKTPSHILAILVDVVSKNGNLLMNFPQRPDGTLDEECLHSLKCLGAWMQVNGEGIHNTRPWKIAGEGPTRGSLKEEAQAWTMADFCFTCKGKTVYAFQMKYPERREAFIRSLGQACGRKIGSARLLGHPGDLKFRQHEDGLYIRLPDLAPVTDLPCLKIQLGR